MEFLYQELRKQWQLGNDNNCSSSSTISIEFKFDTTWLLYAYIVSYEMLTAIRIQKMLCICSTQSDSVDFQRSDMNKWGLLCAVSGGGKPCSFC